MIYPYAGVGNTAIRLARIFVPNARSGIGSTLPAGVDCERRGPVSDGHFYSCQFNFDSNDRDECGNLTLDDRKSDIRELFPKPLRQ